jgi:hypothetical protein
MTAWVEYAAVLQGQTIIASTGDRGDVSERYLIRLVSISGSEQQLYFGRLISSISTPTLSYIAISDPSIDSQRPLAFLDLLSRRWIMAVGRRSTSVPPHSLDDALETLFPSLFKSVDLATAELPKGNDQPLEFESISALEKGEEFYERTQYFKWETQWQCMRPWVIPILIIAVLSYICLTISCGGWRVSLCF